MDDNNSNGLYYTLIYNVYNGMLQRCYNKNAQQYKNYDGRGIIVCDRWRNSFLKFYEDMGDVVDGMSLDRIDNNGNYEPSNCKWSTRKEQANNRRSNVVLEFNGQKMNMSEWAKSLGISRKVLWNRLRRDNWALEKALTTRYRKV